MSEHALASPRQRAVQRDDYLRLAAGLTLVAVVWPIAWLQARPFSDHYFFPLWLGYILSVDALLALRTGTSPIRRAGWRVAWLFVASVPLWWVFEGFNELVDNWQYHLPRPYPTPVYILLASIAFSTVVPAVLTTTELVRSFRLELPRWLPAVQPRPWLLLAVHLTGWLMVLATWLWPRYAFPFVWLALVFLLDPLVTRLGGRSVAWHAQRGDWTPVLNLGLGTLACGLFWEMWNWRSMPKWTYEVPFVEFWHVFEMPLLGYTGYLPFGLEVWLVAELARVALPWLRLPLVPVSSRLN